MPIPNLRVPNLRLMVKYGVIFYMGYRMGVSAEIKEIKERYVIIPKAIVQTYGLRTEQLQRLGIHKEIYPRINSGGHSSDQGSYFYTNQYRPPEDSKEDFN